MIQTNSVHSGRNCGILPAISHPPICLAVYPPFRPEWNSKWNGKGLASKFNRFNPAEAEAEASETSAEEEEEGSLPLRLFLRPTPAGQRSRVHAFTNSRKTNIHFRFQNPPYKIQISNVFSHQIKSKSKWNMILWKLPIFQMMLL